MQTISIVSFKYFKSTFLTCIRDAEYTRLARHSNISLGMSLLLSISCKRTVRSSRKISSTSYACKDNLYCTYAECDEEPSFRICFPVIPVEIESGFESKFGEEADTWRRFISLMTASTLILAFSSLCDRNRSATSLRICFICTHTL